jgi:membrane glycosyltransferase
MTKTFPISVAQKMRQRSLFFTLAFMLTSTAAWVMADLLWRGGITGIEMALLVIFTILFSFISLGFAQAVIGFLILWRGKNKFRMLSLLADADPAAELPVTAIVMPIFNEDVASVYEGLRAIYHSVEKTGHLTRFDFFVLSDSNDPNKWIEEELAWVKLCKEVDGFGRIFYRKRKAPLNAKSGNISDFCRRWGSKYRYMVILDADSIMTGTSLVNLVRLMEAQPQAGIIQTAPLQVMSTTFFGRFMQFAGTLYGSIFQAGLSYWQVNDGNYWGHNAIIRVAPFMAHCGLPDLPASKIPHAKFISHDYVEAALMRRGNYEVWLVEGLSGSFEGGPPTLIDQAKRDRRWCRGNFQHSWLIFSPSFYAINRTHLFLGIMSYLASPLWLLFMILGTLQIRSAIHNPIRRFDYDVGLSLFLDIGGNKLAIILASITLLMLFIPKLLGLLLILRSPAGAKAFGGRAKAVISVFFEHLISMLTAPLLMLFNTEAIAGLIIGKKASWLAQRRNASGGASLWQEVIRTHAVHTLVGVTWGIIAYKISAGFFWWMSPIFIGLICSIPLSMLFGSTAIGSWLQQHRIFITPQEETPAEELAQFEEKLNRLKDDLLFSEPLQHNGGFIQAIIDPYINAIHIALLRRNKKHHQLDTEFFRELRSKVLSEWPGALNRREQMALLMNPDCMIWLHEQVWQRPPDQLSDWWNRALHEYNNSPVSRTAHSNR